MKKSLKFKVIGDYPYSPHKIGDIVSVGLNQGLATELLKYPNFFLLIEEVVGDQVVDSEIESEKRQKRQDSPHYYKNRVD